MLRAIHIDDEKRGLDALQLLFEHYIPEVRIVANTIDPVQGVNLIEDYKPEIVFLDIDMPFLNGFELVEQLKWVDFNLIFVTAHNQHALKAIKQNALDYLLKPVDHNELRKTINRI